MAQPLHALNRKYRYAVVWAPIPILTWLMPCIGHAGICDSEGNILDFAGPFTVNVNRFLFGKPTRYLALDPELASAIAASAAQAPEQHASDAMSRGSSWRPDDRMLAQGWDQYLAASADLYGQRMYSLLTDNCHALVVHFLRSIQYGGSSSWDMVKLAAVVFLKAKYVSWAAVLQTWLPFVVIMPLGIYFGGSPFLYGYAGLVVLLVGWFLLYTYCIWKPCPRSMPASSQTSSMTWSAS